MMRRSAGSYWVVVVVAVMLVAAFGVGTAGADSHTPPAPPAPKTPKPPKPGKDDPAPPSAPTAPAPAAPAPGPAPAPGAPASPATTASTTTGPNSSTATSSQLVDTSHQVADIQKKIAQLQSKDQLARTGALTASAAATGGCGFQAPAQIFAPWGDLANYALAPQGNLANTSNWSLKNTTVAADHDPFTAGINSLLLTNGSEAVTPAMCVNLSNPTIRLFLKNTAGTGKSDLLVSVLYEDTNGHMQHLPIAKLRAGSDWTPTISIPIAVNILSAANASGVTAVAFDFKPEGLQKNESYSLDGVYVDPFLAR
jgi:hypothetical protein